MPNLSSLWNGIKTGQWNPAPSVNLEVADCYPMAKKIRGFCLIIDIETFYSQEGIITRPGSSIDSAKLKELFTTFCFDVKLKKNHTFSQIEEALDELITLHENVSLYFMS